MASSINLTTFNVPIPADHDWLLYTDIIISYYYVVISVI